jgi:hypothetical protein
MRSAVECEPGFWGEKGGNQRWCVEIHAPHGSLSLPPLSPPFTGSFTENVRGFAVCTHYLPRANSSVRLRKGGKGGESGKNARKLCPV